MLKKYRDVICGAVIMVIAVILFISTYSIKSLLGMNPGPDFMPKVASVLLFIVAGGIVVEALGKLKDYVPEVVSDEEKAYRKAKEIIALNAEYFEKVAAALAQKKMLSAADMQKIKSECKIVPVAL